VFTWAGFFASGSCNEVACPLLAGEKLAGETACPTLWNALRMAFCRQLRYSRSAFSGQLRATIRRPNDERSRDLLPLPNLLIRGRVENSIYYSSREVPSSPN